MKYIRSIAALAVIVLLMGLLPAGAANPVSGEEFVAKLLQLQSTFKHGEYWNNYNACRYEGSGPKACPSCSNAGRYSCKTCSDQCGAFYYNGQKVASQCLGFTYKMGSLIFGGNPATWEKHQDGSRLKPGDIIYGNIGAMFDRAFTNHAVFITAVTADTVTFADCNWGGPCKIRWGKTVSRSKANSAARAATVYHAPNNQVGSLPSFSLFTDEKFIATGTSVDVHWLAPSGGSVKLKLSKQNAQGKRTDVSNHTPKATPFTLGKLGAGDYRLELIHTNGSKKQSVNWNFVVYPKKALPFQDVSAKDWYCQNNAVPYVYSMNLFNGISAQTFAPNATMQRSMFVTVLGRLAGAKVDHSVQTNFKDVPINKWYSGYVAWAVKAGIVNGVNDQIFEPATPITREQICKMMVTYCDYVGLSMPKGQTLTFADAERISLWAKTYVDRCSAAGFINGSVVDGKTYFNPTGFATRAQVATIICNFILNT